MSEKTINSFGEGMNTDVSDYVLKNSQLRIAQNMRLLDLDGSSFILTNLKGTDTKFSLSSGFRPVASKEFNGVLYIVSHNQLTAEMEVGSYPSPDYSNSAATIWQYRPLNNLNGGPLRTTVFHGQTTKPIVDLNIQPDYDESVNLFFTIKGFKPRVVNSKFKVVFNPFSLSVIPDRVGATSNSYSLSSINEETTTVLYSDTILRPTFNSIPSGGKLKPGNYSYVFLYMTDDFNSTDVINQSGVFQVAYGDDINNRKGGNGNQETNRRIVIDISNIDTDFSYLKVYVLYSTGTESVEQQLLEFTQPVKITGETMQFVHTGYEELSEVSRDTINLEFSIIESAAASTQVNGYYFLGNIKTPSPDYTTFKNYAKTLAPIFSIKSISAGSMPGYADPQNVYNYLGAFGNEAYPYGIVFRMKGGYNSPVFPIQGGSFVGYESGGISQTTWSAAVPGDPEGVVRYPSSRFFPPFNGGNIQSKYIKFDMSSVPQEIKDKSIGFFFVRGERRTDLVTQGLMLPTMKAPVVEDFTTGIDHDSSYYFRNRTSINNQLFFKHLPYLDNLAEAYNKYTRTGSGSSHISVITSTGSLQAWMPAFINDPRNITSDRPEIFYTDDYQNYVQHWGLLSGDAFVNEPFFASIANIDQGAIEQIGKIGFRVTGEIRPRHDNFVIDVTQVHTAYQYTQETIELYTSLGSAFARISSSRFVPGETFATGSEFVSKLATALFMREYSSSNYEYFFIKECFNAFIGVKMLDRLLDDTKSATNPVAGNLRARATAGSVIPAAGISNPSDDNYGSEVSVSRYNNNNTLVKGAFLVNLYKSNSLPSLAQLYPTIDSVVYKQATPFFDWSEATTSPVIDVFGGDCYISQVHRRLYQNGERNPLRIESLEQDRYNIDMGQLVSWWQESKYNLHLREPKKFDESELEDRSFFPYSTKGDFLNYRKVRYPETLEHSPGYSELTAPKSFVSPPSLSPFIETNFFSRVHHSAKHIPNAFKNGYRTILGSKYRDYDSSMGQIVGLFNHHGTLFIVFEHGLASTTVEARIETASDQAGSVFVESSEVLPTTISYHSREIGCQAIDFLSLIQTPSAIYGYDRSRDKIWQMRDNLEIISDVSVSSFLKNNAAVNPRSGFDPEFNEVIFTSDNWTLCFKEGLEKFVSFYSFRGEFYSRRQKDFFSFLENQAHIHNQPVYTIYGETKDSFIDIVVNEAISLPKTLDFIEIISNEVPPDKVEFYSYNNQTARTLTIDAGSLNQYSKAENAIDVITQEPVIRYRDKRYFVQVPVRSVYTAYQQTDEWESEGRIRDKYVILRLTYRTTSALQLASVISTYRFSQS